MPNFRKISQFCSPLVEVVPASDEINVLRGEDGLFEQSPSKYRTVRLAHSSVKIFLTPAHLDTRWAPYFYSTTVHASVAKTCLCYIIQLGRFRHSDWDYTSKFPFANYSTRNWMFYAAAAADMDNTVHDLILKLFLHCKSAYQGWLEKIYLIARDMPAPAPLYVACRLGLTSILRYLLDEGADPNTDGGLSYPSATYAACERGDKEIIQMLILNDADFSRWELKRPMERTPLGVACRNGHFDIVSMLLDHLHKSNITLQTWNRLYESAFKNACGGLHQNLIQMLLTDISRVNSWSWSHPPFNPLTAACAAGYAPGFCIMLDHLLNDAKINKEIWSKLLWEAFEFLIPFDLGSCNILKVLLTQYQRIDIGPDLLEQLFIILLDKLFVSGNIFSLETLLCLLPQDDLGVCLWERINFEFDKKISRNADMDRSFYRCGKSIIEKYRPSTSRIAP